MADRISPLSTEKFMTDPEPIWLLINLDRSGDRRAVMTRHLSDRGVAFTRIPAVDGDELPSHPVGFDGDLYLRCHGRAARPAEIGCYFSHLRAMRTFLDSSAPFAVILEDDVELSPDARGVVQRLCSDPSRRDWDMVKLEVHHKSLVLPFRSLFGAYRLGVSLTRTTGAAAYLVNRKAAAAYLAGLLPMCVPFDHAFDRGWALGLRVRIVTPCPAWAFDSVNAHPSTIETTRPEKLSGLRKVPALIWRSETELMRFCSSIYAFGMARLRPPRTCGSAS